MDHYFSEKSLYGTGQIEAALASLEAQGLIYEGVLEPPKGKLPEDWEPREQTLFRSTAYGDDTDRPVKKSDGGWTYFAPDIAYHYNKIERGFDELIDVLGADHGGYVKRMKAAVAALSDGRVPLDVKLCQLVRLFKGGEPFKMSKRAGTFVTLRDVIEQVGPDVTRFVMLTRKNDAPLDFDFDKVLEQSKDNPVFYVQYAHARAQSVLQRAAAAGFATDDGALAAADLGRARGAGRARGWCGRWRNGRGRSRSRRRRTSRTGSPSISMSWRRISTRCSIRASSIRRCASSARTRPPSAGRGWRWSGRRRSSIAAGLGILGVTPMDEMR